MQRSEKGFTLIEAVIAVAISVILVAGITEALISSQRTSAAQAVDAGKEAARSRAVDLLRSDLRSRLSLKVDPGANGETVLKLSTTSDSLSLGAMKRSLESVQYIASEKGLLRQEGKGSALDLVSGPVSVEFWEKGDWRKAPQGEPTGIRLIFTSPPEAVVIR